MNALSEIIRLETEFGKPTWFPRLNVENFPNSRSFLENVPYNERFSAKDLTWFHVMLPDDLLDSFLENFLPIKENIALIPSTVCCEKFKYILNDRAIKHKHMLFACNNKNEFVEAWKNTIDGMELEQNEKDQLLIEIKHEVIFGILVGTLNAGKSPCQSDKNLYETSNPEKIELVFSLKDLKSKINFVYEDCPIINKIKKDNNDLERLFPQSSQDPGVPINNSFLEKFVNHFSNDKFKWFHVMLPEEAIIIFFNYMNRLKEKTIISPVIKKCEKFNNILNNAEIIHYHMIVTSEDKKEFLELINEIFEDLFESDTIRLNEKERKELIEEFDEYETIECMFQNLQKGISTCDLDITSDSK